MQVLALPDKANQASDQTEAERPDSSGQDAALVREAKANPMAFAALYQRYVASVFRYIHIHTRNAADAEDLTAEVFADALTSLRRYREQGHFAAWLFSIARRKAADYHRQTRPQVTLENAETLSADGGDPLAQVIRDERLRYLWHIIAALEDDDQELLRLRFAAGLTFGEIAQLLGRKEPAVRQAVHRLLGRLERGWEASDEPAK